MERTEIIKALECCVKVEGFRDIEICRNCPLHDTQCGILLPQNALALITSQEQKIKELTEENESLKQCMEHEHASFMEIFGQYGEKCDKLAEENEAWQKQLIATKEQTGKAYYDLACEVENLRAENERLRAVPEQMKERLQAYFGTYVLGYKISLSDALKAVNQIAKEMLEGKNENI